MRILVANNPLPGNRFLVDLNGALQVHADITHSHELFWDCEGEFDVVHLHFPEYLTFEIQEAYNTALTDAQIAAVEQRLQFWSARATIVVTRHVLLPHDEACGAQWETMYATVYRYADGVAHFASASIDEFRERYAKTRFTNEPLHAVIPHQNYESLPNVISRDDARRGGAS